MLRCSVLLFAVLATAGTAQAGDRYGPPASGSGVGAQSYGAPPPAAGPLLNWPGKAPPPAPQTADAFGRFRPQPMSDWARRADVERTGRMHTPAQGQVVPQSIYNRPQALVVPQSIYSRAAATPQALPSSIYAPAPAAAYRQPIRPAGAPIEIKASDLPDQPTLAQQMAADEAASVIEARLARARLLDAKGRGEGPMVQPQDAAR